MKINICADTLLYSEYLTLEVGVLLHFLFCNIWKTYKAAYCKPGQYAHQPHHSVACLGLKLACVLGIWQVVLMLGLITVGHFCSFLSLPSLFLTSLRLSSTFFFFVLMSFALLNTAIMHWPGADAVDLYTGSCEWAASICRSDLIHFGAAVSLHCFCEALRFRQWTAV